MQGSRPTLMQKAYFYGGKLSSIKQASSCMERVRKEVFIYRDGFIFQCVAVVLMGHRTKQAKVGRQQHRI